MSFQRVFALVVLIGAGLAHAETPGSTLLGDAEAGKTKSAACGACHGMDGNSVDPTYPKLAGQNEAYIVRQLMHFKDGERVNPIMAPFAMTLSEQDMHDLGAYFAGNQATPGQTDEIFVQRAESIYRSGDAKLGVPACMACHGPSGRGMAGAAYPQLSGQWPGYVVAKFGEWRGGTVWGSDEKARIMPDIAKRLSEQDIAALASYAQGLHAVPAPAKK